jgi:general secretion pathway protein E
MFPNEFIDHLTRKGVVQDPAMPGGAASALRRGAGSEVDWLAVTKLTQAAFADELASFYGCPRLQRAELVAGSFAGRQMSARFLRERRLFPFENRAGALNLAVAAPTEREIVRAVELALQHPVELAVATPDDIDAVLATTFEGERPSAVGAAETASADDSLDDLRDLARGAPVVRAIDELLRVAVEQRATDLHIEPFANRLQVRIRVDGLLRHVPAPPASMGKGLLSRLKIMAGLNITERRLPQDGRARINVGGAEVDLRIATMPTMHGEGGVVRLLRKGGGLVALDQLGLSQRDETVLRNTLQAPFGMIIVTGPTGSGKTTTLAAALAEINQPGRKILTIEDPVEYQIPGVNQTQIHPAIGLTFAAALRSFLRQDPDVIMVGEMRDAETAHIGVHAALTGHLVLTTLHTNTAAGAVTRLVDMEVESFLLASCARLLVGQRLVRILCDSCKEARALTERDMAADHRYAALGFAEGETIHHPKGCEWCGFSGFRGRKGVFEVLAVTPAVRDAIGRRTDATRLEEIACQGGMITMMRDGIAKCRSGMTTVDEIFRVAASL